LRDKRRLYAREYWMHLSDWKNGVAES